MLVVPAAIAEVNLLTVPPGLAPEIAAMVEPLACCLRGVERAAIQPGDSVAILGAGPIGLMLSACVADAGGRPEVVGGRAERRALVPEFAGAIGDGEGAAVVIEAAGTDDAWQPRSSSSAPAAPSSISAAASPARSSAWTPTGSTTRS